MARELSDEEQVIEQEALQFLRGLGLGKNGCNVQLLIGAVERARIQYENETREHVPDVREGERVQDDPIWKR